MHPTRKIRGNVPEPHQKYVSKFTENQYNQIVQSVSRDRIRKSATSNLLNYRAGQQSSCTNNNVNNKKIEQAAFKVGKAVHRSKFVQAALSLPNTTIDRPVLFSENTALALDTRNGCYDKDRSRRRKNSQSSEDSSRSSSAVSVVERWRHGAEN